MQPMAVISCSVASEGPILTKDFIYNYVHYGTVIIKRGGGGLDEPYSAKPAQRSSHTGPPGHIGWARFQPMFTGRPCVSGRACTATPLSGVS
jgi:hypothetical protein